MDEDDVRAPIASYRDTLYDYSWLRYSVSLYYTVSLMYTEIQTISDDTEILCIILKYSLNISFSTDSSVNKPP